MSPGAASAPKRSAELGGGSSPKAGGKLPAGKQVLRSPPRSFSVVPKVARKPSKRSPKLRAESPILPAVLIKPAKASPIVRGASPMHQEESPILREDRRSLRGKLPSLRVGSRILREKHLMLCGELPVLRMDRRNLRGKQRNVRRTSRRSYLALRIVDLPLHPFDQLTERRREIVMTRGVGLFGLLREHRKGRLQSVREISCRGLTNEVLRTSAATPLPSGRCSRA